MPTAYQGGMIIADPRVSNVAADGSTKIKIQWSVPNGTSGNLHKRGWLRFIARIAGDNKGRIVRFDVAVGLSKQASGDVVLHNGGVYR